MNCLCATPSIWGALQSLKRQWNSIDWKKVRSDVNRLQTRIAKATHEGKWNLVKRLQYLLTKSDSAKLLAVRIVTQNQGSRNPGIDGVRWIRPHEKMRAALSITHKRYIAQPLKRIYIPKSGKDTKRPLSIPTMYDLAMQALYAMVKLDRNPFIDRNYFLDRLDRVRKCTHSTLARMKNSVFFQYNTVL